MTTKTAVRPNGGVEVMQPARQVIVDISKMTIGDIGLLDEFREIAQARKKGKEAQMPIGRMIAFLDRVVEGGVVDFPAAQLGTIIEHVSEAFSQMMTNAAGGDDPEKN